MRNILYFKNREFAFTKASTMIAMLQMTGNGWFFSICRDVVLQQVESGRIYRKKIYLIPLMSETSSSLHRADQS